LLTIDLNAKDVRLCRHLIDHQCGRLRLFYAKAFGDRNSSSKLGQTRITPHAQLNPQSREFIFKIGTLYRIVFLQARHSTIPGLAGLPYDPLELGAYLINPFTQNNAELIG